jgi:hypothetical protein
VAGSGWIGVALAGSASGWSAETAVALAGRIGVRLVLGAPAGRVGVALVRRIRGAPAGRIRVWLVRRIGAARIPWSA